ncbi:DUF4825 domain-containing protein [Tissierella creatinophila]|uniref:DUF4825 domain-containing protein n=1 Tax=Tissierella creatinophila DSM 6911 TaxID=1123403 RepID=A0A1U7M7M7_TISCR|nr:DUF4825 domain-containing protein [Tissierella creatinophila]OLS03219.1 hypothetical protein TICRE_09200 [Tissierella creatinophila DSM 6911]
MIKKKVDKISSKSLILFLIVSILGTSFLIGCDIEKEENLIDKLYKNKTEYVGDNSKVGNIISNLKFEKGYEYKSMKISSDEKPYSLILNFELSQKEDLTTDKITSQSAILFSLIDNLDEIVYVPVNSNAEGILPVDRNYIDSFTTSVIGMTTKELGKSKGKFKELVEFYEEYIRKDKVLIP